MFIFLKMNCEWMSRHFENMHQSHKHNMRLPHMAMASHKNDPAG